MNGHLTPAQLGALDHVAEGARQAAPAAMRRIAAVTQPSSLDLGAVLAGVARHGRVTLQFHPDRLLPDGRSVVSALLHDGVYRNQFETGISNGVLSTDPGGDRDRWEERDFGGAFQQPGIRGHERPKYGALDLLRLADGPAPRFGSCYMRLKAGVLKRCTYSCGDTFVTPSDRGTLEVFEPVLAGLLEALDDGCTLGLPGLDPAGLLAHVASPPPLPAGQQFIPLLGHCLDDYVEAQIHGDVLLDTDAELLVADPSFATGVIGRDLAGLAERYRFPLVWRPSLELPLDDVPDDLYGPSMPSLAAELHRDFPDTRGRLTAALIGRGAAVAFREPERLQLLKQLWHVLVRCGS